MYPSTSYRRARPTLSAALSRPTRACCTRWPSRSSSSTSPPSSSSSRTSRPSSSSDTTLPSPQVSLHSSPFRRLSFLCHPPPYHYTHTGARNFDLAVSLQPKAANDALQYIFSSIDRAEYSALHDFFIARNLNVIANVVSTHPYSPRHCSLLVSHTYLCYSSPKRPRCWRGWVRTTMGRMRARTMTMSAGRAAGTVVYVYMCIYTL